MSADAPRHLDLKKDRGLTVEWADGTTSYYSIAYLRKMSPSAEQRELRKEMQRNPLTVLPSSGSDKPLAAVDAAFVGNYALRITFSDGHDTGLYSWTYLRQIDPNRPGGPIDPHSGGSHDRPISVGSVNQPPGTSRRQV